VKAWSSSVGSKATLSGAALDEACRVVSEAALELASSEWFHKLAFALAARVGNEPVLTPREILETLQAADPELREHDPEHRVEAHSESEPPIAPWYIVSHDRGELYHGPSHTEAKRVQAQHPRSMYVGSIYG
jgi:hypothetical protein